MTHIAHIRHTDTGDVYESVAAHSAAVARACAAALRAVGLENVGKFAGFVHDMGKCTDKFDAYIRKPDSEKVRGSVNHTFAAVIYIWERYHVGNDAYRILAAEITALAVGSHHGLMDGSDPRTLDSDGDGFLHRLRYDREEIEYEKAKQAFFEECVCEADLDAMFASAADEIEAADEKIRKTFKKKSERGFARGMLARLLLGGLVKADWSATAAFMGDDAEAPSYEPALYEECFEYYRQKIGKFEHTSAVGKARGDISACCMEAGKRSGGIYTLSVPTGAGKTLASLGFALSHAIANRKRKILYVAPLMSILDQNVEVWRKYLFEDRARAKQNVLEHSSDGIAKETEETVRLYRSLIGGWDAPFVVTTTVQFLCTLFAGRLGSAKRLPALCDSIIVLDEVQSLPKKTVYMTNIALNFLAYVCGATIVMCSATQPTYGESRHALQFSEPRELVPMHRYDAAVFRRTQAEYIRTPHGMSIEDVERFATKVLDENDSLLIVCNTKRTAKLLYDRLRFSPSAEVHHLSAGMCKRHRIDVLAKIYASLARARGGGKKTICVSTQVIEAGVDISFSCVIRMLAGVDGIAQSAGRCNRSGEYEGVKKVYVLKPHKDMENLRGLSEIRYARDATEAVAASSADLLSETAVSQYYRALFFDGEKKGTFAYPIEKDYAVKTLYDMLSGCFGRESDARKSDDRRAMFMTQSLKTAGELFEVFDGDTADVIVPYGDEGKALISDLYSERAAYDPAFVKRTLAKCMPYTVSVYGGALAALERSGMIRINDLFITANSLIYSDEVGLVTADEAAEGGI